MEVTAVRQKKENGELAPPGKRGEKPPDPAWTRFVFWDGRALALLAALMGREQILRTPRTHCQPRNVEWDGSVPPQKSPAINETRRKKIQLRYKTEKDWVPISLC